MAVMPSSGGTGSILNAASRRLSENRMLKKVPPVRRSNPEPR
jgi:hypothetical protein